MALELIQQIEKLLGESQHVLILIPQNPSGDAVASAWAFHFFLQHRSIQSTIAFVDEHHEADRFSYLKRPEKVTDNIYGCQDFMLSFKTTYNRITNVRTEELDSEFRIFITPEKGSIDPRDFSFIPAKFKFDLVVALDAQDKESFGKIFEESPDIFYEVPIINIDHRSTNDNFGQINMVVVTASSTAEILTETFEKMGTGSIDETIANCLLSGIISATDSFQKKNTTPKSLQLAARLMEYGADQQLISRYLFKTQPLNLLKLWGRVMVKMNWEEDLKLTWAVVGADDFVQSRTSIADIPFVLEKLRDNYSSGKIFLVAYIDTPGTVAIMLKMPTPEMATQTALQVAGSVSRDIVTVHRVQENIDEAVQDVIAKLRKTTA